MLCHYQRVRALFFALYLETDKVRSIHTRLPSKAPAVPRLDIVWDPIDTPPRYRVRPEWLDGHCGITGLERPPGVERQVYKLLRLLLLELSEQVRLGEPPGL